MVDTSWMRQLNRKTPALQPAGSGYDPWAAWKQGNDPYAPQTLQAPYQTPNTPTGRVPYAPQPQGTPYTIQNWGDVPGRTENPYPQWSGPATSLGGNPFGSEYARTATPDPHGNLPGTFGRNGWIDVDVDRLIEAPRHAHDRAAIHLADHLPPENRQPCVELTQALHHAPRQNRVAVQARDIQVAVRQHAVDTCKRCGKQIAGRRESNRPGNHRGRLARQL